MNEFRRYDLSASFHTLEQGEEETCILLVERYETILQDAFYSTSIE